MLKYVVTGGRQLHGDVAIGGAKNAAVAIIPAALMASEPCVIENVPRINDVTVMLEIIRELGAKVRLIGKNTIEIDPRGVKNVSPSYELVRKTRAGYYILGVQLGMYGSSIVSMPGGCDIGVRAIDQHIKGFNALGAEVKVESGFIHAASAAGKLHPAHIYLDQPSVGATVNIILAAVLAEGQTIIENVAKEPHIVDLANFLNTMGANIRGAGTDVIKIQGVKRLGGCTYSIIPDQIEAGTFISAVTATGGEITLRGVIPKHLECITAKFQEMGVEFFDDPNDPDAIVCRAEHRPMRTNIKTLPYPGFPTDMQAVTTAALCTASGASMVSETIFENRFRYVEELKRMGAQIQVEGKVAVVEGVDRLTGAPVRACDLRAGAALMVAALGADGVTEIEGVNFIERGYEDFPGKLGGLGANIKVLTVPDVETAEVG